MTTEIFKLTEDIRKYKGKEELEYKQFPRIIIENSQTN